LQGFLVNRATVATLQGGDENSGDAAGLGQVEKSKAKKAQKKGPVDFHGAFF
jgi:hypothetical protein